MLSSVKKKVRAVIHSETKQAVLEVEKRTAATREQELQAHEQRMRSIIQEELRSHVPTVRGGGYIYRKTVFC